jgi:hypothetical protein
MRFLIHNLESPSEKKSLWFSLYLCNSFTLGC